MDKSLLISAIESQERSAIGYQTGNLAQARADSLSAYLAEPYGNEQEGRSQVVSSDVSDVIESVMPGLIRVFSSGDEICSFAPRHQGDEEDAAQETETVNYYLTSANNFVPFLQTWLRDGLISKNGYAKAIWTDEDYQEQETYSGLDDNELTYLMGIDELEVVEQSQDMNGLWSVKLKKTIRKGKPTLYNCPPEQILVNGDHTEVSLRKAKFVQHRVRATISDIREMGYDIDDEIGDTYEMDTYEEEVRERWEEGDSDNPNDPASRVVTLRESYIRIDYNNDGHAELRKVVMVGKTVLENVEWDTIPICAWSPVIMPHRHIGRSLAEMAEDIQKTKTSLLRSGLDSMSLSIHGRWAISDKVSLDDMLVSRPGGIVRMKDGAVPGEGHVMPLIPPAIAGQVFPALEYMDGVREVRTGVMRMGAGLQTDSINKMNSTATGANLMASASAQRNELIARSFAEVGFRDLALLTHELIRKHCDKEMVIRLRDKWVPVDPREWKTRMDMTISVGLGTGNREQQLANIMLVGNAQQRAFEVGIVTPENVYNLATKLAETAGFKSPEQFFTMKKDEQPQLPPEVQQQMEQGMQIIQGQKQLIEELKAKINEMKSNIDADIYKADKSAETALATAEMNNSSKEMITVFQSAIDALVASQQGIADRITGLESMDVDLSPVIEAMQQMMSNPEGGLQ